IVTKSYDTACWLASLGIRFIPRMAHAFEIDGRYRMSPGIVTEAVGGGEGLIERQTQIALKNGVSVRYNTKVLSLLFDGHAVHGVRAKSGGAVSEIGCGAVVLACGGFEANPEWRARYLGPGWDLVKVRGTRFNTGDGLRMALAVGAAPYGHWSGCHAVSGDANAPDPGDVNLGDIFQRHSYPLGIMVN